MSKTTFNMEENVVNLLCYVLGWISGLVIILIEKNNENVRFHAMHSIIIFGGIWGFNMVLRVLMIRMDVFIDFVNLIGVVLWIILMIKAYQGEKFKLPVVTDLAEEWSKNITV